MRETFRQTSLYMTHIRITPEAMALARRLVAEFPEYDYPTTPILAIRWSAGSKDSRRGPNGQVVWDTIEPSGWVADIAPWGHTQDARLEDHAIYIDEIPVLLVHRAGPAKGNFVVSEADGGFRVEYHEI